MITDIYADFEFIESCLKREVEKKRNWFSMDRETIESKLYYLYKDKTDGIDSKFRIMKHNISTYFINNCKMLAYNYGEELGFNMNKYFNDEKNGKILCSSVLINFARNLKLKYELEKQDLKLEIKIIHCLHDCIGNNYYYIISCEILQKLFENAIYLLLCNYNYSVPHDFELAETIRAMKRLKSEYVVDYKILNGDIILSEETDLLIQRELEKQLKFVGGFNFILGFMNCFVKTKYNKILNRYIICRDKRSFNIDTIKSRIPYNYLIQLSVKHLGENGCAHLTNIGKKYLFYKIIQISKDYLSVLNLQSYDIMEDIFIDYKAIPLQISRNIFFEKMYTPIQYEPDFTVELLEKVYLPIAEKNRIKHFNYSNYIKFCKMLLSDQSICVKMNLRKIYQNCKISHKDIDEILKYVSCDYNNVNYNFLDFKGETNYRKYPLIKLNDGTYFWLSSHFNGFSFCEIFYTKLKESYKGNLNKIKGLYIERWIKSFFTEKGYAFHSGKYTSPLKADTIEECDMVIENEKKIIFLEIKNCPLPEEFELGDDVKTFRILADGMLKAQLQCAKHQYNLMKNGELIINVDSSIACKEYKLIWNNRQIFKVSVCSQEYLFLTNKIISEKLLQSLLTVSYHTTDPKLDVQLNKLNDYGLQFEKYLFKYENGKINVKNAFHNSLFRSAQQIYATIKVSKSLDDLIEKLTKSTFLIDGSGDVYQQLLFL